MTLFLMCFSSRGCQPIVNKCSWDYVGFVLVLVKKLGFETWGNVPRNSSKFTRAQPWKFNEIYDFLWNVNVLAIVGMIFVFWSELFINSLYQHVFMQNVLKSGLCRHRNHLRIFGQSGKRSAPQIQVGQPKVGNSLQWGRGGLWAS